MERAFETIKREQFVKAVELMSETKMVIDAGFSIGENNKINVELIIEAVKAQKTVFSLRQKKELENIFGKYAANISSYQDTQAIIEACRCLQKNGGGNQG